jgi:uncharacterized membrane protein
MNRKHLRNLTIAAMVAALYVLFTWLAAILGLSSQPIQLRFSEALCILPYFTPAAIPGLFIGCLLANLLVNATIWDIVFGGLATLIGALGTYALRRFKWLTPLPPILANSIIIPFVIAYSTLAPEAITLPLLLGYAATVGIGEILSCGVLGILLMQTLQKYKKQLFNLS